MSNELIDFNGLTEYKARSDLKYQGKLTAGSSISLNNGVISANPTYSGNLLSGSKAVSSNTVYQIGSITLSPGTYYLNYTCHFSSQSQSTGYRACSFSTSNNQFENAVGFYDIRAAANGASTQTAVNVIFQVSASDYPNGRTFYFLAMHNYTIGLTAYPRAYYIKF